MIAFILSYPATTQNNGAAENDGGVDCSVTSVPAATRIHPSVKYHFSALEHGVFMRSIKVCFLLLSAALFCGCVVDGNGRQSRRSGNQTTQRSGSTRSTAMARVDNTAKYNRSPGKPTRAFGPEPPPAPPAN